MSFPAIIRHEMQKIDRPLPDRLEDCLLDLPIMQMRSDSFLFTTPLGTRFHYRKGEGIAIAESDDGTTDETSLFYNGTVYGAVAWLNGLVPLHASSVVKDDRVIAFTGESGEGKSTLAVALAEHGFRHRSDDVLLLDCTGQTIMAWPDRDRIKLCSDAFELTGARRLRSIEPGSDKFFAELQNSGELEAEPAEETPLPLTDLIVLESGDVDKVKLRPHTGVAKFPILLKAMYRFEIATALGDEVAYRQNLQRL